MARINDLTTFPNTTPALDDHVLGTDVSDTSNSADGESVTFKFSDVKTLLASGFDAGQSWSTVSRAFDTSYQNTAGYPIQVSVSATGVDSGTGPAQMIFQVSTDNSTWVNISETPTTTSVSLDCQVIVPDDIYYRVNTGEGSYTLNNWAELS